MKKMDNFLNCLDVLKQADFSLAAENEIYRTGIVGQFNLTFELAWKLYNRFYAFMGFRRLKQVLREKSCS